MKIRKYGLGIAIIIIVAILIDYHFFFLFPYSDFMSRLLYWGRYAVLSVLAFGLYFYLLTFRRRSLSDYNGWMMRYCAAVIGVFVLFTIYTMVIYPEQKLFDTLIYGGHFGCIVFAVPILFLFERDGGAQRFLRVLNVIAFLWYGYTILQSLVYSQTGTLLFSFQEIYAEDVNIRNEALRVGQDAFGVIMLLYNVSHLLYGTGKKGFSLAMIILGACQIILVQQTRMMILACCVCLAILVLFYGENRNRRIIRTGLVLAAGAFLAFSPMVSELLQSLSIQSNEYAGSTLARGYAVTYFWNMFCKNPMMGFAWPYDASYANVAHGALGTAYTNDVGFIGMLAELGLFSIVIFIIPLIRMIYILRKTRTMPRTDMRMFLVALLVFVIMSSFTLIITDDTRCLGYPVVLALYEYYYAKNKHMVTCEEKREVTT